jgi:hypothetical protein
MNSMVDKGSSAFALLVAGALAAVVGFAAPARAQTAAELQLLQACGGNLVACANVAQQLRAYQALGGNAAGMNQVLNAAAAAANAARGQTINPSAYGASQVVTPTNSVGAIAASQQYGQCVQAAGQNAGAAQACMRFLPPEWAAMAQQAQNAYLANPQAANAAVNQVMANAQAMAAGNPGAARELQTNNPFASAMSAMAGQMGPGLAAQAAQTARGGVPNTNALAMQQAYIACIQASGGNPAVASACAAPVQQAYGGMLGAQPGYNPVNNANAVVASAGSYQACVVGVGVTNAAGIQACQARYLGMGAAPANPMFGQPQQQPAPAAPAAPYNPFAAMMGGR